MYCNQIFSLLQLTDSETVTYTIQNIIVASDFEKASKIARAFYGNDAKAIDTTSYPVGIGFTYKGDVFYDTEGNAVKRNQTDSERITELELNFEERVSELEVYNADLLFQVCLLQLGLTEDDLL